MVAVFAKTCNWLHIYSIAVGHLVERDIQTAQWEMAILLFVYSSVYPPSVLPSFYRNCTGRETVIRA